MMDYFDYYRRTIEQHNTGLKLVSGGTGLGKTSRIPRVIAEALPPDKDGIYVANRIQLLEEMKEEMPSEQVVMLPRDLEVVATTMEVYRNEIEWFLSESLFEAHAEKVDVGLLKKTMRNLDNLFRTTPVAYLSTWEEEYADQLARTLLWDFRTVILTAKDKSKSDYTQFLDHPIVQSLFPFIGFNRRPEARLLLVSIHKLFYGFFDGTGSVNANRLNNYVIFADEFDFLEKDLISLITRGRQISDPFRFVEFFYREMERHKLRLQTYPVSASENIRKRINDIMAEIEGLHEDGIHYPDINQFISTQNPQDAAIFRTSHTVSSSPLYLCETERAFEIMTDPDHCSSDVFNARRLFTAVSSVSDRILTLLKELETEDARTHEGLIVDCYHNTTFPRQIREVSQFPRRRPPQSTRLGALLDAGYNMYDIHYIAKATDPEEIELRNYSIHITPEKFMSSLAENNLVFALSATADIPRCVNHFNLKWLGAKDGVNVMFPDKEDRQIIANLNAKKAAKRNNSLSVEKLEELDSHGTFSKRLSRFIETASNMDEFGKDTKTGHLTRRVKRFFAALLRACDRPSVAGEVTSHLMFLNTYRQIKFVLDTDLLQQNPFFQVIKRSGETLFDIYELIFNDREFLVIFYNAEQAKRVHRNEQTQMKFNALFTEDIPVVVVTQYLSAGNGVNLQYRLTDGSERDFVNLYLLETPHFYFHSPHADDTVEDRSAKLKENLWYLAKLHTSKYLSESEFRAKLGTLHNPVNWNNDYKHHSRMYADYQLNTLSALIQALGRIERVWEPMPDQSVVLCREAYHTFQQFLSPQFEGIRMQREILTSHNLSRLMKAIEAQIPKEKRAIRRERDPQLIDNDITCKKKIESLVSQFHQIRQGKDETGIRHQWRKLRIAGLKHDFTEDILQDFQCVFSSPYLQNGEVWLTPKNELIPEKLAQPDTRYWRFNVVYDIISENRIIQEHFAQFGYELDFELDGQHGFVPSFFQAILSGAIGEEAIHALLTACDIGVEETPLSLFEVADLKVADCPWYIDCKNYSDRTLEMHALFSDAPEYYHKFTDDYFRQRAIAKWHQIANVEGESSKLIYINLATDHERNPGYYVCDDGQLLPVHNFESADVIVIQGALRTDHPNAYHDAFEQLLDDMETT